MATWVASEIVPVHKSSQEAGHRTTIVGFPVPKFYSLHRPNNYGLSLQPENEARGEEECNKDWKCGSPGRKGSLLRPHFDRIPCDYLSPTSLRLWWERG